MDTPTPPVGWPFLVAAGRRRDYTVLLAPDFLVASLDQGVLERVAQPDGEEGRPTTVDTRTGRGQPLSVVYATHRLTDADVAVDGGGGDSRDEHGRPLRLIYGYATRDGRIVEPAAVDLSRARGEALRAYRSFLADEEGASVAGTGPFRLASTVEAPVATTVGPADTGRRVGVLVALVAAVVLVLFAVGATLLVGRQPQAPPVPCANAASPVAKGLPTPSCPASPRP